MEKQDNRNLHWNYYYALEQDLLGVSRFIELDVANFETYSIELAHLLLAASSEVDVVLKQLCVALSSKARPSNIREYYTIIEQYKPFPKDIMVLCSRYALSFTPWSEWTGKKPPAWWQSNNKVKHERNTHFCEANLGNTLNAVAALFITNVYMSHYLRCNQLKKHEQYIEPDLKFTFDSLTPTSQLFKFNDPWLYMND